jgi:hypothetical protein
MTANAALVAWAVVDRHAVAEGSRSSERAGPRDQVEQAPGAVPATTAAPATVPQTATNAPLVPVTVPYRVQSSELADVRDRILQVAPRDAGDRYIGNCPFIDPFVVAGYTTIGDGEELRWEAVASLVLADQGAAAVWIICTSPHATISVGATRLGSFWETATPRLSGLPDDGSVYECDTEYGGCARWINGTARLLLVIDRGPMVFMSPAQVATELEAIIGTILESIKAGSLDSIPPH